MQKSEFRTEVPLACVSSANALGELGLRSGEKSVVPTWIERYTGEQPFVHACFCANQAPRLATIRSEREVDDMTC